MSSRAARRARFSLGWVVLDGFVVCCSGLALRGATPMLCRRRSMCCNWRPAAQLPPLPVLRLPLLPCRVMIRLLSSWRCAVSRSDGRCAPPQRVCVGWGWGVGGEGGEGRAPGTQGSGEGEGGASSRRSSSGPLGIGETRPRAARGTLGTPGTPPDPPPCKRPSFRPEQRAAGAVPRAGE